jgi:mono/diheme cytochrome c family protein
MAKRDWPTGMLEAVGMLLVLALAFVAGIAGWAIGRGNSSSETGTGAVAAATATAPAGHAGGANLAVAAIGDPAAGRELFVSKNCSDCHSYAGAGGEDAPPLDFMQGHLSAAEIANMSGRIWDHLPVMLGHFKEEGIPVPTFQGNEMADLIAYLHSGQGGPPPVESGGGMEMSPGETMGTTTGG